MIKYYNDRHQLLSLSTRKLVSETQLSLPNHNQLILRRRL